MSRRYRRNGTPIGDYNVYAIAFKQGERTQVFEVKPQGVETYEDLEMLVMMEELSGAFGYGYDRLVVTRPGADLSYTKLQVVNLEGANLRTAHLYGANLRGAKLQGANLRDANLYGAILVGANLYGADLRGANLYCATLYGANLERAHYPNGDVPEGWRRTETGHLTRA